MSLHISIVPKTAPAPPVQGTQYRVVWDDENPDLNFKCRTQDPGFIGPDNPPAVMRFYPEPREKSGDFRVNLASPYDWKQAIVNLNHGDVRDWEYLVGPTRATYNTTGWPMQAYLSMSGNHLRGEFIDGGKWFRFETLKPSDLSKVAGMTRESHPHFVQHFTCVTFKNGQTIRIDSTGTPRGEVLWFLVTKEGIAYIPARHVTILSS